MPNAPKRRCTYPGCKALVERGTYRCPQHPRDTHDERESASERGYDAEWRKIRLMHLRDNPTCHDCGERGRVEAATEVHHITKIASGGTHDPDNLMSLCRRCHQARTNRGE